MTIKRNLTPPELELESHTKNNQEMHDSFVSKFGESAMYGYDPRPKNSTDNNMGLVVPKEERVYEHADKVDKLMTGQN